MIIGAKVVFIVELARVSFVAYCAVEEAHSGGEGIVALASHVSIYVCMVQEM